MNDIGGLRVLFIFSLISSFAWGKCDEGKGGESCRRVNLTLQSVEKLSKNVEDAAVQMALSKERRKKLKERLEVEKKNSEEQIRIIDEKRAKDSSGCKKKEDLSDKNVVLEKFSAALLSEGKDFAKFLEEEKYEESIKSMFDQFLLSPFGQEWLAKQMMNRKGEKILSLQWFSKKLIESASPSPLSSDDNMIPGTLVTFLAQEKSGGDVLADIVLKQLLEIKDPEKKNNAEFWFSNTLKGNVITEWISSWVNSENSGIKQKILSDIENVNSTDIKQEGMEHAISEASWIKKWLGGDEAVQWLNELKWPSPENVSELNVKSAFSEKNAKNTMKYFSEEKNDDVSGANLGNSVFRQMLSEEANFLSNKGETPFEEALIDMLALGFNFLRIDWLNTILDINRLDIQGPEFFDFLEKVLGTPAGKHWVKEWLNAGGGKIIEDALQDCSTPPTDLEPEWLTE